MRTRALPARMRLLAVSLLLFGLPLAAQFRDDFEGPLVKDPDGAKGWGCAVGEGRAVIDFLRGPGFATIAVDATKDRRNVWWAIIVRQVSGALDLALLRKPGHELRIEARVRTDTAPRRVNLSFNTRRTTDFHSHLMEYDLAEAGAWYTISLTTRGFDAGPGDIVNAQMALMDWGLGRYRVDVDYVRVDVVEAAKAGPDLGPPIPYHPPVADPASFSRALPVAADLTVDLGEPDVNLGDWTVTDAGGKALVNAVGGSRLTLLRWDPGRLAGARIAGSGLLELTTRSAARSATDRPDFGLLRVVEIFGGKGGWDERTATWTEISEGRPRDAVLDPQMIIDWPVTPGDGGKTYLTIPAVVLQRLVDGKTLGIALTALGSLEASFYSREERGGSLAARLLFDVQVPPVPRTICPASPGLPLEAARDIVSKIPVRGEGTGRERRAKHTGATRRIAARALEGAILIDILRERFIRISRRNPPPCMLRQISALRSLRSLRSDAGEPETIPEQSRKEGNQHGGTSHPNGALRWKE